MTQAEYRRPRNTGRRKIGVALLLVVVLCLVCFALGIMVGGSGSDDRDTQEREQRVNTVSVREPPGSQPAAEVTGREQGNEKIPSQNAETRQSTEHDGQVSPLKKVESELKEKPPEDEVVQQIPLGSGINTRRKEAGTQSSGSAVQPAAEQKSAEKEIAPAESASAPSVKQDTAGTIAESSSSAEAVQVSIGGGYVVQIASFRAKEDAYSLAQKLKNEFPAYVRKADLEEKGIWYRVLVGPMDERKKADEVRSRIKEKTKLEGFVKKAP
jgi:cell division septation protein DedD